MLIKVSGSDFKSILQTINILETISVKFKVEDNKLHLIADNGIFAYGCCDILESKDLVSMSMPVMYTNVAELISSRDTVTLDFGPMYVIVSTPSFTVTFGESVAYIDDFIVPELERNNLSWLDVQSALKTLMSTGVIEKTLKLSEPIQLCRSYAVLSYPSIVVRTRSKDLEIALSKDYARAITKFSPSEYSLGDKLYLYKESSILAIPITPVQDEDVYMEVLSGYAKIASLDLTNVLNRIQKLYKSLGVCSVRCYVTENQIYFGVTKNDIILQYNVEGEVLHSFEIDIEYLQMIYQLMGKEGTYEILSDKVSGVCFRSNNVGVIISVGG